MNSHVTDEFQLLYRQLPVAVRRQAREAYRQFGCLALAGLLVFITAGVRADEPSVFTVARENHRLLIHLRGQQVAEYVCEDERILRPYFANLRTASGIPVTRSHPPVAETDAVDHDTMHPGLWLGFGEVSGHDFWRNKGRVEHVRFTTEPTCAADQLTFGTESNLVTPTGELLCRLACEFHLQAVEHGWRVTWAATFHADHGEIAFGDQEELGGGVRVATPLTEQSGGVITSSTGRRTAAGTWGQPAAWCDYSGVIDNHPVGVMLMSAPTNFRAPWWHNRDYGLMVANPFGRSALKQGEVSRVEVAAGESLRLTFAAYIHEGPGFAPAKEYERVMSVGDDD